MAAGVRTPHQKRSRPSTRTIVAVGMAARSSSTWESLNSYGSLGTSTSSGSLRGDVREHDGRIRVHRAGGDQLDADAFEDRGAVGVLVDRHPGSPPDRHEGGPNGSIDCRRWHDRRWIHVEQGRQVADHRHRVVDAANTAGVHAKTSREELVVVLETVLLAVHDHQVGPKLDDGIDVGVLRAADMTQLRLFTESCAGDHIGTERQQRLGTRRHETDHAKPHRGHESSRRRFWRSNSSGVRLPRISIDSSRSS